MDAGKRIGRPALIDESDAAVLCGINASPRPSCAGLTRLPGHLKFCPLYACGANSKI